MLRCMGYSVFDCDTEARRLMDADNTIKARLAAEIAAEVVEEGTINRQRLSAIVFADAAKLAILNSIVHGAVRADLARWRASSLESVLFVETAILYQSGLNNDVDAEWCVTAPESIRIQRVMARNGLSREAVEARIASQAYTPPADSVRPPLDLIVNDGVTAVLPRVLQLLAGSL